MPFSDAKTPPEDVFERFLAIVERPENRPVLLHCEQGFHRTGILAAAYRIRCCGWPIDRALEEMRALGFDPHESKRRGLYDALLCWATPTD